MAKELAVVKWYVDGCHRSADDPHLSHSNATCARDAVRAIIENWWPSGGDYALNFDVVILAPTEWVGRYPVEVESVPNFVVGKPI